MANKAGFSKAIAGSIVAGALTLTSLVGGVASADGDVDGRDFLIWKSSFGTSPIAAGTGDLNDWQSNYGAGAAAGTIQPDPEFRYVPVRR